MPPAFCNRASLICFSSCAFALFLVVHHNVSESSRSVDAEWLAEYSMRKQQHHKDDVGDGMDQVVIPLKTHEDNAPKRLGDKSALEEVVFDESIHKAPVEEGLLDFSRPNFLHFVNPPREQTATHFTCGGYRIPSQKSADGKSIHEHVVKYSRYVNQYCNRSGMLQMNVDFKTYGWILDKIAVMARIKRNAHIFDWGSGCGTMLNYFHLKYNTTGIGIDITENAIAHAKYHAQPGQQFCHMDGSNLRMFPSDAFDAIVSWATLYHIRRTLVQCDVVHNFVRMLKPGGVAYVGHLRTEKTQEYWKKGRCRHENATIVRYRDFKTFHQPSWKRHQFFSVIVTKHKDGMAVTIPKEDGGE